MGRLFAVAIACAWLSAPPLALCAPQATEESHFQPAKAVSVSDVTIPFRSVASGTVVLDVTISEQGEVRNVQVRRDITSITEEAVRSVRTWKFQPAKLEGNAVTSRMTVAVTFNPAPPLCANIPLPPLIHRDDEVGLPSSFHPPVVTYATFPACAINAANPGTVILEASLNEAGKVQRTKTLRDAPPFTAAALRAMEDWRFTAATLNGRRVESKVVLVFCFRPPVSYWPY
jgi:TonB family protein